MNKTDPPQIFIYPDFAAYLTAYIKHQKEHRTNGYSYLQLARRLGVKSGSLLTQIGRGARFPTPSLLYQLKKVLKWSAKEYQYAEALVSFQKAKTSEEKNHFATLLRKLKPGNEALISELDKAELFGKWYTTIILELTRLKSFQSDPHWIAGKIGREIKVSEVNQSLKLLERLELIARDSDGKISPKLDHIRSPEDIPVQTIRSWNKQMLEMAAKSQNEQTPEERFLSCVTLSVSTKKISEAQERIRQFCNEFCEEFETDDADETYQFGVHYFRMTDKNFK